MPDLVVIVPSRGRPHTVAELVEAFKETCTADTVLLFAVDLSDETWPGYERAVESGLSRTFAVRSPSTSMGEALQLAVQFVLGNDWDPVAVAFMGDDHRPRTKGWDRAYLDALAARPGIVYGDDQFQGERLPTQCAMSASVVRALGHMAPPVLQHLYLDNYWRTLGQAAGCLTYLPDVVVEHVHPVAGKAQWDEGYARVNRPELYEADRAAFEQYWAAHGARDLRAVYAATGRSTVHD
jgi:hypothetical protein